MEQDYLNPVSYDLFEEVNPPEFLAGELKSRQASEEEWEPEVIKYEGRNAKWKTSIEMVLCVHGWEKPDKTKPMSLILFEVGMYCLEPHQHYKAIHTWFTFEGESEPQVLSYAPFDRTKIWAESEQNISVTKDLNAKLSLRPLSMGGVDVTPSFQMKKDWKRISFARGSASREFNIKTHRWDKIWWFLEENELQERSLPDCLNLAVLVKRKNDAPFSASFAIRTQTTPLRGIFGGVRRIFSRQADKPVPFLPSKEPHGRKWEKVKALIHVDQLGNWNKEGSLIPLINISGLELSVFDGQVSDSGGNCQIFGKHDRERSSTLN